MFDSLILVQVLCVHFCHYLGNYIYYVCIGHVIKTEKSYRLLINPVLRSKLGCGRAI